MGQEAPGIADKMTMALNIIALLFAGALSAAGQVSAEKAPPESAVPPDAEIRKILAERIDAQHQSVGIVVGVIEPRGRRIIAYGHLAKDDARPLDGDTVFEIGSVTKVFTALLLTDMVERKEVALSDPVAKYLPPDVKVPERGGQQITLESLSRQVSGLPRLPTNLAPKDPANPYADYTPALLYKFLSGYTLTRDIGSQYEYSNLGVGLLGHALARRAGMDYEALVRSRIAEPLGMKSTGVTLTPEMKARLAVGHNAGMAPVKNWDLPTLAGAGALRSTANDMLSFLAANLGYTQTPLDAAMAAQLKVHRPTGSGGMDAALGWLIFTPNIVWHNGGTGGYRSFIGFNPEARVGVVVLSNAETAIGVDDIGHHLLDPKSPLVQIRPHHEVVIDPKLLDLYVGRYQFAPGAVLSVTREGNQLSAQLTGQPKFPIYAESERGFFLKVVDAQLTFEATGGQKATAVVLHQNGRDQRASRIEGEPTPPKQHKEVAVDPKVFDRYVGRYTLAPGFILTVTTEGGHIYTQATGQQRFEVFPESERDYFAKDFDGQITFEVDAQGRATGLVLHQNGQDRPAPRGE
jgi:CubicO group peptidase (beta-lactamase class C family)